MSILCASCGQAVEPGVEPCPHCGGPVLLRGRYQLEAIVGQGAAGITYRAHDAQSDTVVAVKEMPLRHTDAELGRRMEREARVLSQLHHDRIPAYIDHFTQGTGKQQVFYLVQGYVDGPTLAQEMERRRYTEAEVLAILSEVAAVLTYLHGLMPPVVHRDIKLKNIIRRSSDGQLVLIDFGAVRDVLTDPRSGGSTVAGTYGYMAPEQYLGDATPQSDLYALGALGVVLLTRKDPLELVKPDHSLDWRSHVRASAGAMQLIDDLLQADPAKRPASAREVQRRIARVDEPEVEVLPAPRVTTTPVRQTPKVVGRSRKVAMALGVLGSPLGIHWWYLGRPTLAILSLIFVWTGVPIVVALAHTVWMMYAGERRFNERYNPAVLDTERTARLAREVETLHTLYMKGALSQAEFEREKARLLGTADTTPLNGPLRLLQLFDSLRPLRDVQRLIETQLSDELRRRDTRRRRNQDPPEE